MANLFKGLKPKAHLSSNGFDLSQKHVFSCSSGMLLPVACWETVPNDYFEINMVSLMRTMTLNTAAFIRGKQRFDFYFVPYSQIWHPFNQFITQRQDAHSVNQKGFLYVPTVALEDILYLIFDDAVNNSQDGDDIFGYKFCTNAVRLLDMLGYGNYNWLLQYALETTTPSWNDIKDVLSDYNLNNKRVNIFRLAAYQHIWYDIYRNKFYDLMDRSLQQTDYISCFNFDDIPCTSLANSYIDTNTVTNFDDRMYGLFRMRYVGWKKDLFTGLMPSQQFGAVSSVTIGSDLQLIGSPSVSVSQNSLVPNPGSPSIVFNSSGQPTSTGVISANNGVANDGNGNVHIASSHGHNVTSSIGSLALNGNGGFFDVLTLYKAEMLQNWKQKTLRSGNMVDANFEAHFGTSPYYNSDENVRPLGSFEAVLNVDPVETTTQVSGSGNVKVGDLGAKAQAVANGDTIKFDCRDYGVIMCLTSYVPEADYASNMIDKNNTLYEQFDFFTPEFENIGLEAVETKQMSTLIKKDSVLGYAPRYWNYKGAVDKIHNGFFNQSFRKHGAVTDTVVLGNKVAWAAPKESFYLTSGSDNFMTLASFYVDPAIYDNVFGVEFNVNHDYITQEDTFVNNVYFDVKVIRTMSKLGLPEF